MSVGDAAGSPAVQQNAQASFSAPAGICMEQPLPEQPPEGGQVTVNQQQPDQLGDHHVNNSSSQQPDQRRARCIPMWPPWPLRIVEDHKCVENRGAAPKMVNTCLSSVDYCIYICETKKATSPALPSALPLSTPHVVCSPSCCLLSHMLSTPHAFCSPTVCPITSRYHCCNRSADAGSLVQVPMY